MAFLVELSSTIASTISQYTITLKKAGRNFLPRSTAFFDQIPIESLRIRNSYEMHLGKKFLAAIFSVIVYCFRETQIGFEQVFDNVTFKHIDTLRKQIQSLIDYVLNHCF